MTLLAPTLQAFFTDRLMRQRQASPHTIRSYRDTWRLLLLFAAARRAKPPRLDFDDLSAPLISAFLDHLEDQRATASGPGTCGWPRSTRCSPTPPCATPSTPTTSLASWPSRQAIRTTIVTHLAEEETAALLQAPVPAPGQAVATTP